MKQKLNNQTDSFLFVDNAPILCYSDARNSLLQLNIINQMNKELVDKVVGELRHERGRINQGLETLREQDTPSTPKVIEELEQKSKLIDATITQFGEYLAFTGVSLNGVSSHKSDDSGAVVKSRRSDYVSELIEAYPVGREFAIDNVRTMANQTYPGVFGKSKKDKQSFYAVYWGVINQLQEEKKIKVAKPGKAKRSTVFVRI